MKKRNTLPALLFLLIVVATTSCNNGDDNNLNKKSQKINLFRNNSDASNLSPSDTELSYGQALKQCHVAFLSTEITLADSSDPGRSNTVVFIYRATNVRTLKSAKGTKLHKTIFFISPQKLVKSIHNNDSATIFLKEIKDYKWIHRYLSVNYGWLDNAPY